MVFVNYIPVYSISPASEYNFNNPDINEVNNNIDKTTKKHDRKNFTRYMYNKPPRKRDIIYDLEFIDKRKNKIFNIKDKKSGETTNKNTKMIIARQNHFTFKKTNKLNIIIEGRKTNHVINTYLNMRIRMGVRRFFTKIAHNKDFIDNFCNDENNIFHHFYRDWYLYNLKEDLTKEREKENRFTV